MANRWTPPRLRGEYADVLGLIQRSFIRLDRALWETPMIHASRLVTASDTVMDDDDLFLVDATSGSVTLTLPLAKPNAGRRFTAKKMDAGANNVIFGRSGTDTIDGATSLTWNTQYQSYTVQAALTASPDTYNWVTV